MKENNDLGEVTCTCGLVIPDSGIEYRNSSGEDNEYYEGEAECSCDKKYEWSKWYRCEGLSEAKEDLQEYINKKKERANKYEEKLIINGTLDDVLRASLIGADKAKEPKKDSE